MRYRNLRLTLTLTFTSENNSLSNDVVPTSFTSPSVSSFRRLPRGKSSSSMSMWKYLQTMTDKKNMPIHKETTDLTNATILTKFFHVNNGVGQLSPLDSPYPFIPRLCILLDSPTVFISFLILSQHVFPGRSLSCSTNLHHRTKFDPIGIIRAFKMSKPSYSTILDNQP